MEGVRQQITIDRPREEIFAYLSDVANLPEFTDHFLKDWRLTRADSVGAGAGARYRQSGRFDRFGYYDLSLLEVDPSYRIVAVGRGGKYNRIETYHEWILNPDQGGTRIEYFYEAAPGMRTDRWVERLAGRRGWFKRGSRKALRRLRSILEEDSGRGGRASIAGLD